MHISRPLQALSVSVWPEVDRRRWLAAQGSAPVAVVTMDTVKRIALGYGCWLRAVSDAGKLNPVASPAERVTRAQVVAYIEALHCAGMRPRSIVTYLWRLRAALRVMEPEGDFAWIISPLHRKAMEQSKGSTFLQEFPPADRVLWDAGTKGSQGTQAALYGSQLSRHSLHDVGYAYRNWLRFLRQEGLCFKDVPPGGRLTEIALRQYKQSLEDAGYSAKRVIRSFAHLRTACRIMHLPLPAAIGPARKVSPFSATKFEKWPITDRALWIAAMTPGDLLDDPSYAAKLVPDTVGTIIRCYGYWLSFLQSNDILDLGELPASRVTPQHVRTFLDSLRSRNLGNATILRRLFALRSALRIMQPDADMDWLASPGGRSLSSFFPTSRKPLTFIHSKVLYEWGWDLMREALSCSNPQRRQVQYRDGLLIALLAARAPRLSSIACLRLGKNVVRHHDEIRIAFEKEDMKNRKVVEYSVPPSLKPAFERYLAVERSEMMGGKDHEHCWVTRDGHSLQKASIRWIIRSRSKARFGREFGPHYFRHSMGTTGPMEDPTHPGVAASILNITGRVLQEHYTRAGEAEAAQRFLASLVKQREHTRTLASREFRQKRRS